MGKAETWHLISSQVSDLPLRWEIFCAHNIDLIHSELLWMIRCRLLGFPSVSWQPGEGRRALVRKLTSFIIAS